MRSYWNLPEEITIDILSRLPAKPVGRCRCVSKSWRALLSRSDFIRTHLHRSRNLQQESLFFISICSEAWRCLSYASLSNAHHLFDESTIYAKQLKFAGVPKFCSWIYGSCDGLLLVGNWGGDIVVLNPITGEIRKVPDSPFALDPRERFIAYGFGYDSVSDDYKIVTISCKYDVYKYYDGCAETFVDVYSLKTDTWKKAGSSPYNHAACVHFISGVFVDGCIHWLACRNTDDKFTIVAFDLAQEKFREVPPPSPTGGLNLQLPEGGFSCLVVLCGRLCAFTPDDADVWVMEKYGVQESWTKLTVYPKIFRPSCMLGQKEIVLKGSWSLVVYNLEERTVMDIDVRGIRPDALDAASFVESLVSPHGTNQRGRD